MSFSCPVQETFKRASNTHVDFLVVAIAVIELKAGLEDIQIKLSQEFKWEGSQQTGIRQLRDAPLQLRTAGLVDLRGCGHPRLHHPVGIRP